MNQKALVVIATDGEASDGEVAEAMRPLKDLPVWAKEIHAYNPWLTYGEPLQRLREFGCSVKELDLLDERRL
eukprot:gene15571-19896_t